MPHLYLADLADLNEDQVKQHISAQYAGVFSGLDYGNPSDSDKAALLAELDEFDILVAYEHVGSWGCDSASYFLIRQKATGSLFEVRGGHCSCYGFEGQWSPEAADLSYLTSDKFCLGAGGYDNSADEHTAAIKAFFQTLVS